MVEIKMSTKQLYRNRHEEEIKQIFMLNYLNLYDDKLFVIQHYMKTLHD